LILQVKADSFFNFFSPPAVPDDPEAELEEEVEMNLQQDFQIGHFLRLDGLLVTLVPH
jgi:nucleosome assembly protein 1-like 1